jgi:hypothetical protein
MMAHDFTIPYNRRHKLYYLVIVLLYCRLYQYLFF